MIELLKCPFCGGEAKFANDDGNWIVCNVCDAESAYFESRYEAIEAWNTRKPVEEILALLEEGLKVAEEECFDHQYIMKEQIEIVKERFLNND